jgi:LacI family transcriptional regulator
MQNVSIKDVATHAGVSSATITRVINQRGYVAGDTRRRVEESIKTLGYIPNRMAKALKNSRTGIIGNVLPLAVDNFVFSEISLALRNSAIQYGYQILPVYTGFDCQGDERLLHELIGRMVEGIIFTSRILSGEDSIREVLSKKIPVITMERLMHIPGVDTVNWDNYGGSDIAASFLFEKGHRNIAFIGKQFGPERDELDRFEGFRKPLERRGVKTDKRNIRLVFEYTVEYGYRAMKQIIEQSGSPRPTGCYVTSDKLLCGALQYLYEAGLRVPKDISIISFDNTLSAMCSPPISTVAIPFDELGHTAVSMLLERREQNRSFDKTIKLMPHLVDRGSVIPLASGSCGVL